MIIHDMINGGDMLTEKLIGIPRVRYNDDIPLSFQSKHGKNLDPYKVRHKMYFLDLLKH